ncbi:acyl-CoA dehydrogenase family protein [Janibacter limosus]|uniref:Acyl-CoA dehydrogenase family protein n=1 Tax=Janibacter limosus TaxID=53458 RepID=A0AC61U5D9_9MICO|nr:acyl-CoA dehydrogenase family protein [Janibacter limosus]UUZ45249.1 acyl-CoA dehydrogenase family protein [Janibacter limosus]
MHRTLFDSDHEDFRSMVRRFFADRAVPPP